MSRKCKWFWAVSFLIPFAAILAILLLYFVPDPEQETTGAIRVSPIVPRIIFDDADSLRPMPNYDNFKRTEAARMASDVVLNRVADKLKGLNLRFFQGLTDPVMILRQGIKNRQIIFDSDPQTELIVIRMTSRRPTDAEKIINAFLDSYLEVYHTEETKGGGQTMTILEDQRQTLLAKMDQQRDAIAKLIEEYGTRELTPRESGMFRQVERLHDELINANMKRIALEVRLQSQQSPVGDITLAPDLQDQLNTIYKEDQIFQNLLSEQRKYETLVAESEQSNADGNPELQRRKGMLKNLSDRVNNRRDEISNAFDKTYKNQAEHNRQRQLAEIKAELDQTIAYEKGIQEKLDSLDVKTINLGRKQFAIDDQQEQLDRTKAMYNEVCNRIEEFKVESMRPARISAAFRASSTPIEKTLHPWMIVLVAIDVVLLVLFVRILMSGVRHPLTVSAIPRSEGPCLQDDK